MPIPTPAPPRPLRRIVWSLTALALITLTVLWRTGTWDSSSTNERDAQPAFGNEPGLAVYPDTRRSKVPEVTGTTLEGEPLKLSDFVGDIVVINVWGSWCGPCRAETPDLVRLARENADRGVKFLGIATRDNVDSAKAFAKKFAMPYPSIFDDGGRVLLPLTRIIPTAVIPSTVVVDREGKVAARVIGPVTYSTLNGVLADELAGGTR